VALGRQQGAAPAFKAKILKLLATPGRVLLLDARGPSEIASNGGFPVYLRRRERFRRRDNCTDWSMNAQRYRALPKFKNDVLSFSGTNVRENSALDATFALDGRYSPVSERCPGQIRMSLGDRFSGTIGCFNIIETPDPLFLSSGPRLGQRQRGGPRNSGCVAKFAWWLAQNFDFALPYAACR
jgi:hypothetical protein